MGLFRKNKKVKEVEQIVEIEKIEATNGINIFADIDSVNIEDIIILIREETNAQLVTAEVAYAFTYKPTDKTHFFDLVQLTGTGAGTVYKNVPQTRPLKRKFGIYDYEFDFDGFTGSHKYYDDKIYCDCSEYIKLMYIKVLRNSISLNELNEILRQKNNEAFKSAKIEEDRISAVDNYIKKMSTYNKENNEEKEM